MKLIICSLLGLENCEEDTVNALAGSKKWASSVLDTYKKDHLKGAGQ